MPSEYHVRISFGLIAMCLLSADCSFNEMEEKRDQMEKKQGGRGGDKRYELILTTWAPVA